MPQENQPKGDQPSIGARIRQGGTPGVTPESQPGNPAVTADPAPATPEGEPKGDQTDIPPDATPNAQKRIRMLAKQRNELDERVRALEAELATMRARAEAGIQQPTQQPQAAPEVPELPPFPEMGSAEEQKEWYLLAANRAAALEAQKATQQLAVQVADTLKPFVAEVAQSRREREWNELSTVLERAGTSREELEPTVREILAKDPTRGVKSAAYQVMFDVLGLDGFSPAEADPSAQPTPVAQPTSGPQGTPSGQGEGDEWSRFHKAKESGDRGAMRGALRGLLRPKEEQGA